MIPESSYLVCATPRSGSTLVCQALKATGVAGNPEEYFEALLHSGRPRRPEDYFTGIDDPSILDHLGERWIADDPPPRSPLWSRTAYDRYLEWAMEAGTTPNGMFGAKLMWGYFGDFVSLLRNIPRYRDLPLAELMPTVFPNLTFVRVVRANKVRQAVSLWKAVQTARWRQEKAQERDAGVGEGGTPPYKAFIEEHRPQLRFHYRAIAHLLDQILARPSCSTCHRASRTGTNHDARRLLREPCRLATTGSDQRLRCVHVGTWRTLCPRYNWFRNSVCDRPSDDASRLFDIPTKQTWLIVAVGSGRSARRPG